MTAPRRSPASRIRARSMRPSETRAVSDPAKNAESSSERRSSSRYREFWRSMAVLSSLRRVYPGLAHGHLPRGAAAASELDHQVGRRAFGRAAGFASGGREVLTRRAPARRWPLFGKFSAPVAERPPSAESPVREAPLRE